MELYQGNAPAAAKLVSAIPPDDSDTARTARLVLIADPAQNSAPVERGRAYFLKLDNPGRCRSHCGEEYTLPPLQTCFADTTSPVPPLHWGHSTTTWKWLNTGWRAPLLRSAIASRLNDADTATARRRDAAAALAVASPYLGYSISNKTSGLRLDLRDELREMTIVGSGK